MRTNPLVLLQAFDIAEKEFGIIPVMSGYDMACTEVPDKLTMVSYLSQFYEYFKKEAAAAAAANAATKSNYVLSLSCCAVCEKLVSLVTTNCAHHHSFTDESVLVSACEVSSVQKRLLVTGRFFLFCRIQVAREHTAGKC